jgi:hypothetical protein
MRVSGGLTERQQSQPGSAAWGSSDRPVTEETLQRTADDQVNARLCGFGATARHPFAWLASRSSRFGVSSRERRMVDQNSASWNQLSSWLRPDWSSQKGRLVRVQTGEPPHKCRFFNDLRSGPVRELELYPRTRHRGSNPSVPAKLFHKAHSSLLDERKFGPKPYSNVSNATAEACDEPHRRGRLELVRYGQAPTEQTRSRPNPAKRQLTECPLTR